MNTQRLRHFLAVAESGSFSEAAERLYTTQPTVSKQIGAQAGFAPAVAYSGTRMENIVELVASGMGVSLMMRRAIDFINKGTVSVVPLEERFASRIALARPRRRRLEGEAAAFWRFVREAVAVNGDGAQKAGEPLSACDPRNACDT